MMILRLKKILACLFSACCLLQALLELAGLLGLLPPDFLSFESFSAAQAMWLLFLTLIFGLFLFWRFEKQKLISCTTFSFGGLCRLKRSRLRHPAAPPTSAVPAKSAAGEDGKLGVLQKTGAFDFPGDTGEGSAVAASYCLALTSASLYLFFFALRRGDLFIQLGVFLLSLVLFSLSRHAVSSAIPAEPQRLFPLGLALTTAIHFILLLLLPGGTSALEPEQVEAWSSFLLVLLPALLAGVAVFLFASVLHTEWGVKPRGFTLKTRRDPVAAGSFPLGKGASVSAEDAKGQRGFSRWLLLPLALLHIGVLSRILVLRVQNFNTPNFDFGLFVQMFYNMAKTGLPLTTLERNTLLSHFQIHFSPIFYLLLPFYKLWPRPETLQILQILVAASALIPAILIVRELRLPRVWQTALCALLLLHPGLSGSSMYDLHENCFLAPLILWLLWAALRRKWGAFSVFALLLLGVKEDAFIYLFSVGLWLLCGGVQGCEVQAVPDPLKAGEAVEKPVHVGAGEKRQAMKVTEKKQWQALSFNSVQLAALFSMLAALIFFAAVSAWLKRGGEGLMFYRFENIQALPDWGLLGYALTAFSLPGRILEQLFMPDKLLYLLKMLLPFGLLPLFGRRLRHSFLLLPFVVINLLANWSYQYNLNFQYHYGTTVLIFFVSAVVLWESQTTRWPGLHAACPVPARRLVAALLAFALFSASALTLPEWTRRLQQERAEASLDQFSPDVHEALAAIPENDCVYTSSFFAAALAARPSVFEVGPGSSYPIDASDPACQPDVIVLDERYPEEIDAMAEQIADWEAEGFVTSYRKVGVLRILKKEKK